MSNNKYIEGLRQNLIQGFGADNVPDAKSFEEKMKDEKYANGIYSNLEQLYGKNEMPDKSTYYEKVGLKKKENTTPNSKDVSTSSSGVSTLQSQKQSSVVTPTAKIQEKQYINVTGNTKPNTTFLPISEQQKKAGQDLLGTGTKQPTQQPIKEVQKQTYPSTQELIKQSGGIGSDVLENTQAETQKKQI